MNRHHTAGSWVVKGLGTPTMCVVDPYSAYIVDRFTLPSFRNMREQVANATLIATAPDLLAKLNDLARAADVASLMLRETHPGEAYHLSGIVAEAKAIIEKATAVGI